MSCEEIQSKSFYLAEDDPEIRKIVEEHLDSCSVCDAAYSQYNALLDLYRSDLTSGSSPALVDVKSPVFPWRLARIAAVLILGLLLGVHWRSQRMEPERAEALQWSQPELHIPVTYSDSRDREFQARVESVEDSLARLKSQTSNNQF